MCKKVAVFDLDDTLYKERDYLISAYREIEAYFEKQFGKYGLWSQMLCYYDEKKDAFEEIIREFRIPVTKDELIEMYRAHKPNISIDADTKDVLDYLQNDPNYEICLITDGRHETQWNKIRALGLDSYAKDEMEFIISEDHGHTKPDPYTYKIVEGVCYPNCTYVYVGDNPDKDFKAPNKMGWDTVCLLDNGRNIHKQNFNLDEEWLPKYKIKNIKELLTLI